MKQFENLSSTMEAENHSKNLASLKSLKHRGKFLFLIILIFTTTSCVPTLYIAKSTARQNEISTSPNLRQFLNNKQPHQISIVLRTSRTTSNVTQEVQNNELYNTVERKLMNAGFVVRDRALLEKLIVNEQLSYESIAEKIKVDLIIEVLENSRIDNNYPKIFRQNDNKEIRMYGEYSHDFLNIITSKLSFRIVIAETGAASGFYTFYYTPCINGCNFYAKKAGNDYLIGKSREGVKMKYNYWMKWWRLPDREECSWIADANYISDDLSNKIINILKGK